MDLNKLVLGGVAAACVVAAGAGSFVAVRQNRADAGSAAAPPAVATPLAPPATTAPVTTTDGVVTPPVSAPAATAAPKPAPPAPTAKRETPAPRPARTQTPERRPSPTPAPIADRGADRGAAGSNAPADTTPPAGSMWETRPAVEPERTADATPPEPPAPTTVELVVPADAVLGLKIERTVTSETAAVEDRVEARVTRDVRVGERVAIPAGSVVQGSVIEVERGGKLRDRAHLGVRFHTVVLADGTRVPLRTEAVTREGASPSGESTAKIGGAAAGGAILGAILGGGRGAAIGGAIGAAGGTAATMAGGRNAAVLPQGTTVTVRIQQPVTLNVEQDR